MSSWIIRRDKLDPEQRSIVDAPINNNMWISGFAGSGKSVILVHKAITILERNPDAKVLFVVYTQSLVDLFRTGLATLNQQGIEVKTIYEFMDGNNMYDYILCDEVQDCTESMISAIKSRARRNVIVAGDKFQSIYEQDVRFKEPTINPRTLIDSISARIAELTKIYRLTPSIIDAIDRFLPTMRLAINGRPNAEKVDVTIKLCKCSNKREESAYVYNNAGRYISQNERTAILFPKHQDCIEFSNYILDCKGKPQWEPELNRYNKPDFGSLNRHLASNGIKLMYVGNGYGSLKESEDKSLGVIMTYQSSKGLDFEHVYLPFANNDMFITYNEQRSKTIFMVAMSRSSRNLTISYSGQLFQYVVSFKSLCTEISPNEPTTNVSTSGEDFDF